MKKTGRLFLSALAAMAALLLMGMGSAGSPGQTPADSPFTAKVRDTSNNEISISSVTFDGQATFNVLMGKGRIQIPLENISRIDVKDGGVCVTLKGAGSLCNLKTSGISRIYGKIPYGSYQISLKDVVSIDITKAKQ
ncbi:MAG TPA: hypothetical protein PLR71_05730 [Deltaproteobacteria bacterium]|nr:hypothetical protein [Deltaproteobacteria bacterium]